MCAFAFAELAESIRYQDCGANTDEQVAIEMGSVMSKNSSSLYASCQNAAERGGLNLYAVSLGEKSLPDTPKLQMQLAVIPSAPIQ